MAEDKGSPFFIILFWVIAGIVLLLGFAAICNGGYAT